MTKPYDITMHDKQDSRDAAEILAGLQSFNAKFAGARDYRELTIAVRDPISKKLVAGLHGSTQWGWLFVKWLWVSEECRGRKMGSTILTDAEKEARERGCRGVWLDTFSFQAPGFYEKQGYARFGTIEGFPEAPHARHFYSKALGVP